MTAGPVAPTAPPTRFSHRDPTGMDKPQQPPQDPDKRGAEGKKPAGQPVSFIWYLLALFVLLMLAVTLFSGKTSITLDWTEFEKLVEASYTPPAEADTSEEEPRPAGPGYLVYLDRTLNPERQVRLSNLKDLVVGNEGVAGKVTRQVLPLGAMAPSGDAASGDLTRVVGDDGEETSETEVRFLVNWNRNLQQVGPLLDANNLEYKAAARPSDWLQYLPMWIFMALLIGMAIFMLRRLGGAGSPMAFGRSRGKLYAQEDLEVTFDDVAGIDEACEELREVVDFLKTPERYQRLGGRIPKGVLLVGPPGTGKTLLSKAVAGEAGVPFFSLSGSDFVEMFVGVGAARVRDMFQQAEQKAPCIVFIDELDALGKTRGNGQMGSHDEREQTLNALLVEMDGFGTNSGIIIMGATNRPETLDPALLRPGRFDRQVLVDRPDVSGRKDILEVHLANVKVGDDVDVEALAAITSGFVGADLANIVNEAALLAARGDLDMVTMAEFNEAVERVGMGLEKKSRIMQDDEKLRTAYHDAGHALVAYALPNTDPVHKVTIIPRGLGALGYMWQRPETEQFTKTKSQLESQIQVALAGTVAEELVYDEIATGATSDLEKATEIARAMVMDFGMSRLGRVKFREQATGFLGAEGGYAKHHSEQTTREIDQEVKRIVDQMLDHTRDTLRSRRDSLEAVTKALMEKEVIDGDELKTLIENASAGPKIVPGTLAERKAAPPTKTNTEGDTAEG